LFLCDLPIGLSVLDLWPQFITLKPDASLLFVQTCVDFAVREPSAGPDLMRRLGKILQRAFEWEMNVDEYQKAWEEGKKKAEQEEKEKTEETKGSAIEKRRKRRQAKRDVEAISPYTDRVVGLVVDWIKKLCTMAGPTDFPAYHSVLHSAGLDLCIRFGNCTRHPVAGKAKGGKEQDKEVWRPQLEELLDVFCRDSDPVVRKKALGIITEERTSSPAEEDYDI